jgi:hypothetical protein
MRSHLDVEHQVEPQDGEQEAGPGADRRGHDNNLEAFATLHLG